MVRSLNFLSRLVIIFAMTLSSVSSAEIMFEGYAKILVGAKHYGYTLQRYEFDKKKKQFKSTSIIKTNTAIESVKAVATDSFKPVRYTYTMQEALPNKGGSRILMIDGKFNKGQGKFIVSDGKKPKRHKLKLKKHIFLSSFLGYLMLQKGIGVGKDFVYEAVAEEDGKVHRGTATVVEETKYKNIDVYKIENKFKGQKFTSWVTKRGEVLATNAKQMGLRTELVANREDATAGFGLPKTVLKKLFGNIPEGKINVLAKKPSPTLPSSDKTLPGGKSKGVAK